MWFYRQLRDPKRLLRVDTPCECKICRVARSTIFPKRKSKRGRPAVSVKPLGAKGDTKKQLFTADNMSRIQTDLSLSNTQMLTSAQDMRATTASRKNY